MINVSHHPAAADDKCMEQYKKRSRMQSLRVWATEVDIIAAASLLNAMNHIHARCDDSYKWLTHSADEAKSGLHQDEYISINQTF